jgi:excisionase family DNA binding protein
MMHQSLQKECLMPERWHSVEEVAEQLGLHVRTVRGYVRDGRLPAVRIGKQYRIAAEDLAAFTRRTPPQRDAVRRHRHVEVSSIVQVDAASPEVADRVTNTLMAATGTASEGGPVRVQTVYDPERAQLKVVIFGGLDVTADLRALLDVLVGTPPKEEP